jgi:Na+/H+ antiporter NhaD/arsenite permease-like protein
LGSQLPLWSVLPFVALLASIAVLPLAAPRFWHANRNRALVAAAFAVPFAIALCAGFPEHGPEALGRSLREYASFILLLAALYVIAGGVHVRGSLAGSPLSNTMLLGIGALLANVVGTTGASMILIRPLLRANRSRERRSHVVVFFLFVVSNCGGLLTPLGDPPLFLGFLKGVPFGWTFSLAPPWLVANGLILLVFNFVDQRVLESEELARKGSQLEDVLRHEPLAIVGKRNLLLLGGVIAVLLAQGSGRWPFGVAEACLVALAIWSYAWTEPATRRANTFTFGPIAEVAILFAGIFVTMLAPLEILNARGGEIGLARPWHYFWATGSLSSVLDNAPTYLAFAAAACGRAGVGVESPHYLAEYLARAPEDARLLQAISCGAVFMGSMTYLGNGPNLMVRAIAEENGVKMPSFGGYLVWSALVLLPIFALVSWLFFR